MPVAHSRRTSRGDWPECHGFSIVGKGPCYVIDVRPHSVAHSSGLCPGDQLLQVDGHDVSGMSADAIKVLAARGRNFPPTLSVVSRLRRAELLASRRWGYGMRLSGVRPTVVEGVDPPGPAYQAGIRKGESFLCVHRTANTSKRTSGFFSKIVIVSLP